MGAKTDHTASCGKAASPSQDASAARAARKGSPRSVRARRFSLFIPIAVLWIVFDQATKAYFDGAYFPGQVIGEPILGIFRFHLVYNTGGAWSIFSGATWALGAFSLIVCIALTAYLFFTARESAPGEAVGLALVVAGGIGNAIDRFALGHVIDFIEPVFIEFPVFNVADIGVTCGFVIFFVSLFLRDRARARKGGE